MAPTKIMIIRHGEKPVDGSPEPGLAPDGTDDPASLTAEGWKRARRLVGFFVDPGAQGIMTPTVIFACKPLSDSRRPMETVSLLAMALWNGDERPAHFITHIDRDDIGGLAAAIRASSGVCLVAWEHHRIPDIVARFQPLPPAPTRWPGHRFDVVWVLDAHGGSWAFSQTPQNLLHGDSDKPIKSQDG